MDMLVLMALLAYAAAVQHGRAAGVHFVYEPVLQEGTKRSEYGRLVHRLQALLHIRKGKGMGCAYDLAHQQYAVGRRLNPCFFKYFLDFVH